MANPNRCTIFPRAEDLNEADGAVNTLPVTNHPGKKDDSSRVPRIQEKRRFWLGLPVKDNISSKKTQTQFCQNSSPWLRYQKFMTESNVGKTCIANQKDSPKDIVAIKQYRSSGIDKTGNLLHTSHPNIVNLIDSFFEYSVVHLAYELMEISLEQLHSGVTLKESDIAFVCKEVRQNVGQLLLALIMRSKIFHGLWYIHRDLSICHTRIDCSNIFLSAEGRVKIGQHLHIFVFCLEAKGLTPTADIGASLLEQHRGSEQHDIKCVGYVATEILRPGAATTDSVNHPLPDTRLHVRQFVEDTDKAGITIPVILQVIVDSQIGFQYF